MGFSIDDGGVGPLGILVIVVALAAAGIVAFWLFSAVRLARREALDLDPDHKEPEF